VLSGTLNLNQSINQSVLQASELKHGHPAHKKTILHIANSSLKEKVEEQNERETAD